MTKIALQADGLFITKFEEQDLEGFSPEEIDIIMSRHQLLDGQAMPELWLHYDKREAKLSIVFGQDPPLEEPDSARSSLAPSREGSTVSAASVAAGVGSSIGDSTLGPPASAAPQPPLANPF